MTAPGRVAVSATVLAPAKLNLGLEVIGRRADGYHDIATVVQTIGVYDTVTVSATVEPGISVDLTGLPIPVPVGGEPGPNLAAVAAESLVAVRPLAHGLSITLTKGIPSAAGLGGASSDAAAVLRAVNALMPDPVGDEELHALALGIGSDVPLFLNGGAALVTGRGDVVEPLPMVDRVTYLVVLPVLGRPLARKTPALYAALAPDDLSSGERVRVLVESLRLSGTPGLAGYANAFRRPLLERWPELAGIEAALRRDAAAVAFSGAGPSLYGVYPDERSAETARQRLLATVHPPPWTAIAGPVSLPAVGIPTVQDPAARWARKP